MLVGFFLCATIIGLAWLMAHRIYRADAMGPEFSWLIPEHHLLVVCRDALVTSTRRKEGEQSIAWMAIVLSDFPCFPRVLCVVYALHGWKVADDDALRCLDHPLEQQPNQSVMQ